MKLLKKSFCSKRDRRAASLSLDGLGERNLLFIISHSSKVSGDSSFDSFSYFLTTQNPNSLHALHSGGFIWICLESLQSLVFQMEGADCRWNTCPWWTLTTGDRQWMWWFLFFVFCWDLFSCLCLIILYLAYFLGAQFVSSSCRFPCYQSITPVLFYSLATLN